MVSYRKLRKIMKEHGVYLKEVQLETRIANGTLNKISHEEFMQLDKLDLIISAVEFIIKKKHKIDTRLDFGDVMERVTEEERLEAVKQYRL